MLSKSFAQIVFTCVLVQIGTLEALGTDPRIEFDVPATIVCREVTTEEFANTHSLEKLLEVRFRASALVKNGSDRAIRELFFFAYSPDQSFRVVEYSPQTMVMTEFAAPIETSENRENANTAGFNFSPNLELNGTASINASLSDRKGRTQKLSKLPPKQLAIASGTQKRESAVYFKFKPNSQDTLEGAHEFSLIIRVPLGWRGDLLHVHCRGYTGEGGEPSSATLSRHDFVIPLCLENDEVAQRACTEMTRAEQRFRRLASTVPVTTPAPAKKGFLRKFENLVHTSLRKNQEVNTKDSLPSSWTGDVIYLEKYKPYLSGEHAKKLSHDIKRSIANYARAKSSLLQLNR